MTDPERLSQGGGLAAQLLRASVDEQPHVAGVERTLVSLGISSALLASTTAAGAAAVSGKLTGAVSGAAASTGAAVGGASSAVSAALLVKWIGIGVVSGVGLAGAAAVATRPPQAVPAASSAALLGAKARASSVPIAPAPTVAVPVVATPAEPEPPAPSLRRANAVEPPGAAFELELGAQLAEEVAFVDRGRALLRSGQTLEGLAQLERYEQAFREARLLPEVLFLRLEVYERLGRTGEARRTAERLVNGFPKSPHAARARKLLAP